MSGNQVNTEDAVCIDFMNLSLHFEHECMWSQFGALNDSEHRQSIIYFVTES